MYEGTWPTPAYWTRMIWIISPAANTAVPFNPKMVSRVRCPHSRATRLAAGAERGAGAGWAGPLPAGRPGAGRREVGPAGVGFQGGRGWTNGSGAWFGLGAGVQVGRGRAGAGAGFAAGGQVGRRRAGGAGWRAGGGPDIRPLGWSQPGR